MTDPNTNYTYQNTNGNTNGYADANYSNSAQNGNTYVDPNYSNATNTYSNQAPTSTSTTNYTDPNYTNTTNTNNYSNPNTGYQAPSPNNGYQTPNNGYTNANPNAGYQNPNPNNGFQNPQQNPNQVPATNNDPHEAGDNPFDDPSEVVDDSQQYKDYTGLYANKDDNFQPPANPDEPVGQYIKEKNEKQAANQNTTTVAQSAEPPCNQRQNPPHPAHHNSCRLSLGHHKHHKGSSSKFLSKSESNMNNVLAKTDDKVGKPIVNFTTKVNDAFTKLFHLK